MHKNEVLKGDFVTFCVEIAFYIAKIDGLTEVNPREECSDLCQVFIRSAARGIY